MPDYEICPKGYTLSYGTAANFRRPTDGPTDGTATNVLMNTLAGIQASEFRQSMFQIPQLLSGISTANNVFGYYADGYFDRRVIANAPGNGGASNSAVSETNNSVAYQGMLIFNPNGNSQASLFFPATGHRIIGPAASALMNAGDRLRYWSSSNNGSMVRDLYNNNDSQLLMSSLAIAQSAPVRCVQD
jgi:hypothetical protein